MENRLNYIKAEIEIVRLESADVIANSVQTSPDGWVGDGNVDSGGWT